MLAYIILLLAALSRLVPHAMHGVGLNITAVGGGLLFFGSRRPRWQAMFAVAVMAITDVYLTRYVYGYPFHLQSYAVTWIWYGAVCLLGNGLLLRVTVLRVTAAVVSSATGFYLLSNLVVWMGGSLYPHTEAGLADCYAAALPFYGNDLVSTALTAGVLFALPVVATHMVGVIEQYRSHQQGLF